MKLEDMYRMKMVGDVQISKEGTVAFVVAKMNRSKDSYDSWIYIHDGKPRRFTTGPHDLSPRFTDDGEIIYLRRGEKKTELRRISLSGGESERILEREEGISSIKIDGGYVYFISSEKRKKKDDVKEIRRIPFYFNGEGFIHDKNPQIYRVPLKGGRVEQLTHEQGLIGDFHVRNGLLVYSVSEDEREPFLSNLYALKNGERVKLSTRPADIMDFQISPDGSRIAVFLKFNEKGFAEDASLFFLSSKGGEYKRACPEKFSFGRSLNSDARFGGARVMQWMDSKKLMFIATVRGAQHVLIYEEGKCTPYIEGNRSVESLSYENGTLAFIAQEINRPGEVYVKKTKERRITSFNRRFESLPRPEHFTFRASDGEDIEGWILLPEGKGPHPAVLEIHGGPKTSYGHAFMFEFYYLLSEGFAVVFTNPRGSSGYGEDFSLRIRGEFGNRDYKDLMEAVDFVLENYPIDKDRVFVTGGSYGGFMTNWIVGHTSRFRAAATQRSISNQLSFWGTSDIGPWFNEDYIGAGKDLWDGFDDYWSMSPLKYAKSIETPLLIIHSEEDYRCPVSEAYQLFYALKMRGKDTKMVLFPGENHDLSRSGKPKHRERRLKEIADWFKSH